MRVSLVELRELDRPALISLWTKTFEHPPPPNTSQDMMRLIIGWELQAKTARSDLRELKSALRAASQASTSDNAAAPFKRKITLSAGTRLSREWQGRTYTVDVMDKGYAYNGQSFTSLTPIAKAITGSHRSGPLFFGVSK